MSSLTRHSFLAFHPVLRAALWPGVGCDNKLTLKRPNFRLRFRALLDACLMDGEQAL